MADSGMSDEPLIHPRLVRKLKERPRLIDFGLRKEVLEQLDQELCRRRSPQEVANRLSDRVTDEVTNTTKPVMRKRATKKMDELNRTRLRDL